MCELGVGSLVRGERSVVCVGMGMGRCAWEGLEKLERGRKWSPTHPERPSHNMNLLHSTELGQFTVSRYCARANELVWKSGLRANDRTTRRDDCGADGTSGLWQPGVVQVLRTVQ